MARRASTAITRRSALAGLTLTAAPVTVAGADNAYAQAQQPTAEKSLYERLGGAFAIAAVVVTGQCVASSTGSRISKSWVIEAGLAIEGVSGMREVEIREFVRTIAEGEGRQDPAREALAHTMAVVLKNLTEDGDVIVRATHEDVSEIMQPTWRNGSRPPAQQSEERVHSAEKREGAN